MDRHERERQEAARIFEHVRHRILDWDLLGVADFGAPRDEYECLVGIVAGQMRRGASTDAIANRLVQELKEHFGIDATGQERSVADDLIAWRDGLRSE